MSSTTVFDLPTRADEAKLAEVETLARRLMDEHGLTDWRFGWSRARRSHLGLCSHKKRTIFLSEPYTLANSIDVMRETILHEIAHALIGDEHGHDETWKAKAAAIGVKHLHPYSGEKEEIVHPKMPKRKWHVGVCRNCGRTIFRRQRRKLSCGVCFADFYHEKFAYRWRRPSKAERLQLERWETKGDRP